MSFPISVSKLASVILTPQSFLVFLIFGPFSFLFWPVWTHRVAVIVNYRPNDMTKASSELFIENNSYGTCSPFSRHKSPILTRLISLKNSSKKLSFYKLTYFSAHKFTRQRVPSFSLAKTRFLNTLERNISRLLRAARHCVGALDANNLHLSSPQTSSRCQTR